MTRPRRAFGGNRPGQLPATRLKIVAAEMSDPQRLGRARQYAHDGSVLDITIEAHVVTATVLGSRPDPYLVELAVEPGFGPPNRAEISAHCSCPDADAPWAPEHGWCKHALAALLVVADEVAIEPDVLRRWRGAPPPDSDREEEEGEGDAVVVAIGSIGHSNVPPEPAPPHPLNALLESPAGTVIPVIDDIEAVAPTPLGDPELDRWLTTAMAILTNRG